jgi:hypothetical protein
VTFAVGSSAARPAGAQTVPPVGGNDGRIISGSVPGDGGFGLIVYGGGTYDQLVAAAGCPMLRVVFWTTRDGSFIVFIPGSAVAAPNEGFLAAFPENRIPANTAFIGRCTPAPASGIQGTVTVGPLCPVLPPGPPYPFPPFPATQDPLTIERPGILPCPDQPYQATLVFLDALGNQAARTTSGADGRYRVVLTPGRYTVVPLPPAEGIPWPRAGSVSVTVPPGVFVAVDIRYDSGIRYLDPRLAEPAQ